MMHAALKLIGRVGNTLLAPLGYEIRRKTAPVVTPGVFTRTLRRANQAAAARLGVSPAVHPQDWLYWFIVQHHFPTDPAVGATHYFDDGHRSAEQLTTLLTDLSVTKPCSLLEFAAGYGCVSRHLVTRPTLDLVSCDIHPAAQTFLTREFGVPVIPSVRTPEAFTSPTRYAVVFALSFFSHMPRATWGPWVRALLGAVRPGGYLIFTTLGADGRDLIKVPPADVPTDGFWFRPSSEQTDLDPTEYGLTVTLPKFVRAEVARQTDTPIVRWEPRAWWGHQDVWVVRQHAHD